MDTKYLIGLVGILALMQSPITSADIEPNNTFANREIVKGLGTKGSLSLGFNWDLDNPIRTEFGTLRPGNVDRFIFDQLDDTAEGYYAWTDNIVGSGASDLMLGKFDSSGNMITFDDDSSPAGNGFASALHVYPDADGLLDLRISGFTDFGFLGRHKHEGDYALYLTNPVLGTDHIDFYTFTGLIPGQGFRAEIITAEFDTTLYWFDDSGSIIGKDYDSGYGLRSRLFGQTPSNGQVHLAVAGPYLGVVAQPGSYSYALHVAPIPEAETWVMMIIGIGLVGWMNVKRRSSHQDTGGT